jgi:hypothetical protein
MNIKQKRSYRFLKIITTLIILVAIGLGSVYAFVQLIKTPVEQVSRFDGEIVCLPLRSLSDTSEEASCEKGLMGKDGRYFTIQDISQDKLKIGQKLSIEGGLNPVTEETDSNYAVSGVITGE